MRVGHLAGAKGEATKLWLGLTSLTLKIEAALEGEADAEGTTRCFLTLTGFHSSAGRRGAGGSCGQWRSGMAAVEGTVPTSHSSAKEACAQGVGVTAGRVAAPDALSCTLDALSCMRVPLEECFPPPACLVGRLHA